MLVVNNPLNFMCHENVCDHPTAVFYRLVL